MRFSSPIELLETRSLFSGATAPTPHVIGPSGGLYAAADTPGVRSVSSPVNLANARRDASIVVAVENLPGRAVNFSKLYRDAFQIFEVAADGTRTRVPTGYLQTSGGGDTLSVTPNSPLKPNTNYTVDINPTTLSQSLKIRDTGGAYYDRYAFDFRTGTEIAIADPAINFSRTQATSNAEAAPYTAVTMGPDGKLYAATLSGTIYRWAVAADGSLSGRQTINTVLANNVDADNPDGNRVITGITFDPAATSGGLKLWVSHGQFKFGSTASVGNTPANWADNYTGKVSVLSGANLDSYSDVIVGIPRSVKDHMNNQVSFDRTGANFYFVIPSMSAMGRADGTWGYRDENALAATMVKVNVAKLNAELQGGPIDLTNATYAATNPAKALNIYATGIRNAYDMVFHTNGHLYSGVNGSSAGGNTPAGGGAPQLTNVPQTEQDVILDVKPGKYYGHPNPTQGHYVLAGGNPTANAVDADGNATGVDSYEFAVTGGGQTGKLYPAGVNPDADYELPAFDLGKNVSPNGMIEYRGEAFGGKLKGAMLVARYNAGQDVLAVTPNGDGTISKSGVEARITGLTGLQNPLDLIEDTSTGNLYVAQLDEANNTGSIALMKPIAVDSVATPSTDTTSRPSRIAGYAAPGNRKGVIKDAVVTNTGTTTLEIDVSATKINGQHRGNFVVLNLGTTDIRILPGESVTFRVRCVLARGEQYVANTNLAIKVNQPATPYLSFQLRAVNVFNDQATVSSTPARGVFTASRPVSFASSQSDNSLDELLA